MNIVVDKAYKLIGNTPMLNLISYEKSENLKSNIFAKLEFFNPAGSVKDRAALYMINDAIANGRLKEGSTIIEPTSGNTGIGIASIASAMGFNVILTMPSSMSKERRDLLSAYGVQIILTDAKEGMSGAVNKANELLSEIENSVILGQFNNKANAKAHFETTGPEIYEALSGKIDYFVAGVGTGGTLTGVGEYLKSKDKNIKIVAVEPASSPLLSENRAGAHGIQGIGANFVPEILNKDIIDRVITVKDEDAFKTMSKLTKTEGVFTGISSGAALWAASVIAKEETDKNVVALLPDTGDRYLSLVGNL